MSVRSPIVRYSLLAAAVAALCGLVYMQVSERLPESLQVTNAAALRQQNPSCALAEVPRDHAFLAASINEGGLHSGLIFGNIQTATKTVQVTVEAGDKPITVFLSGYGVIWNFGGHVDRIRRVVAMSHFMNRMVGVAGVPADRVEIPVHVECSYFNDAMSLQNGAVRAKALAVMFGRRPDHDVYQYKAAHLSLPEASFALPLETMPKLPPQRTLAPGDVVTAKAVTVTRTDVLPGKAGLEQLEAAGAIRPPTDDEVKEFLAGASRPYQSKLSPDFMLQQKFDYAITREVTLPQGFSFGPKFLVLAGVPAPVAPYRGCLVQMDGFRVNSVLECFPGYHEGFQKLQDWPAAERLGPCRLFEPPEDASLDAVSVYEPEMPKPRTFAEVAAHLREAERVPTPYPIDVRVDKPGGVMLVLNSYEPVIWRVSARGGGRVVGVMLIGYYASKVEGLPADTPIVALEFKTFEAGAKTTPACLRMRSLASGAYRGGPDAIVFDRAVEVLTGRRLNSLRGAYKLKEVTLN